MRSLMHDFWSPNEQHSMVLEVEHSHISGVLYQGEEHYYIRKSGNSRIIKRQVTKLFFSILECSWFLFQILKW